MSAAVSGEMSQCAMRSHENVDVLQRRKLSSHILGRFALASVVIGLGTAVCRAADSPPLTDRAAAASRDPAGTATPATGALSGKREFVSPGHGYLDYLADGWHPQRSNTFGLVEDFVHAEAVNQYLVAYLRNAGADVVTLRESDLNSNMVIVDDGTHGTYDVTYPDGISSLPGAADCMIYTGTVFGACVEAESGESKVVYLGFPFETIVDAAVREQMMAAVFAFMDLEPKDVIFYDEFELGDLSRWITHGP